MNVSRIPKHYADRDFLDFLQNITDLGRDSMLIKGGGSLEEWADHFGLFETDEMTLKGLVKLLKMRGCIERKQKGVVRLRHDGLLSLIAKLESQLRNRRNRN